MLLLLLLPLPLPPPTSLLSSLPPPKPAAAARELVPTGEYADTTHRADRNQMAVPPALLANRSL